MRKLLGTLCLCCVVSFSFAAFACGESAPPASESHIPSTPADSADASKSGPQVAVSVVHVMCANIPSGTGFIHKSGWVITAAHVVEPCGKSTMVRTAVGQKIPVKDVRRNDLLDLAILALEPRPEVPRTLTLSTNSVYNRIESIYLGLSIRL
jgi:S1-C subfamily serine protease